LSELEEVSFYDAQNARVALLQERFKASDICFHREYKNVALLSTYVNDIGQVLPRKITGLDVQNQREMAKSFNRAVAFGILPKTRKHWSLRRQQ
jgi:ribosomal protein S18